jgi:hypothetical protein
MNLILDQSNDTLLLSLRLLTYSELFKFSMVSKKCWDVAQIEWKRKAIELDKDLDDDIYSYDKNYYITWLLTIQTKFSKTVSRYLHDINEKNTKSEKLQIFYQMMDYITASREFWAKHQKYQKFKEIMREKIIEISKLNSYNEVAYQKCNHYYNEIFGEFLPTGVV